MWLKIFGAVVVLVSLYIVFYAEDFIDKHFSKKQDSSFAVVGIKVLFTLISLIGCFLLIIKNR